jgi:hypothetical protein
MRTYPLYLIGFVLLAGCGKAAPPATVDSVGRNEPIATHDADESGTKAIGTVTFEINDGEHVESFEIENVREGATLESVMRRIDQVPISIRGSGVTAFVDKIGDTKTSGSEGWVYRVDGEFATRGIGETHLSPPATVQWSFGSTPEP